jgi:high affinity Mn2+ porin
MSAAFACASAFSAMAQDPTNFPSAPGLVQPPVGGQNWNWHVQNTDIVQGYPAFPARYFGPDSLASGGETRETVSLDLMAGVRLWRGTEAHMDGLMWQGFGVNNTLGVDGFPNGEAFRLGTAVPNLNHSAAVHPPDHRLRRRTGRH